jgi:hypothetical protein
VIIHVKVVLEAQKIFARVVRILIIGQLIQKIDVSVELVTMMMVFQNSVILVITLVLTVRDLYRLIV